MTRTNQCRSFTRLADKRRNSPASIRFFTGEMPWFANFEMSQMINNKRHARRLDARLRRHVVARLSRSH